MIYKLLGWSVLIYYIVYKLNLEKTKKIKNKEDYKNKEIKDHGVGTFSVFNTQTIPKKLDEEDYSYLNKDELKQEIDELKEKRENKFNEYTKLIQSGNQGDYTTGLEKEIDLLDLNISKFEKIYYKISLASSSTKTNKRPKYDKTHDESLFSFPMGNLLPVSDARNIFENRIQSFDTDIKIINKKQSLYELDNKVFEDEFKLLIDTKSADYVKESLDYEKVYDDDEDVIENEDDNEDEIEQKGLFRKKEYEFVTEKDIDKFNKIESKLLRLLNNNNKLKIRGGNPAIDSSNFSVIQKKINYILYNIKNKNELIYDGELLIYRNLKNHGKHIHFKVLYTNNNINIISLKIKGIVTEDKIHMYLPSNEFENNIIHYSLKNKYVISNNPREVEIRNMSMRDKVELMKNRKNALRLDRGIR
jgi:hypothetical protein